MVQIEIQTHFGIGDALFLTPTLQRVKEAYPNSHITVNTRHSILFENNPYIDVLGSEKRGLRLMYCDPTSCTGRLGRRPNCHHIEADWHLVTSAYDLKLELPELKPQVYFDYQRGDGAGLIGVQVIHKGLWHDKKNWGRFEELAQRSEFTPIPELPTVRHLASWLTSCRCVVCAEGGISHLCRALDVPCIVVYGGFALPEWNGYQEQTNVLTKTDCSPCYSGDVCVTNPEKECMRKISVDDLVELVRRIYVF